MLIVLTSFQFRHGFSSNKKKLIPWTDKYREGNFYSQTLALQDVRYYHAQAKDLTWVCYSIIFSSRYCQCVNFQDKSFGVGVVREDMKRNVYNERVVQYLLAQRVFVSSNDDEDNSCTSHCGGVVWDWVCQRVARETGCPRQLFDSTRICVL